MVFYSMLSLKTSSSDRLGNSIRPPDDNACLRPPTWWLADHWQMSPHFFRWSTNRKRSTDAQEWPSFRGDWKRRSSCNSLRPHSTSGPRLALYAAVIHCKRCVGPLANLADDRLSLSHFLQPESVIANKDTLRGGFSSYFLSTSRATYGAYSMRDGVFSAQNWKCYRRQRLWKLCHWHWTCEASDSMCWGSTPTTLTTRVLRL
jgi:hypothetical protein